MGIRMYGKMATGCSWMVHDDDSINMGYYYTANTGMYPRTKLLVKFSSGNRAATI